MYLVDRKPYLDLSIFTSLMIGMALGEPDKAVLIVSAHGWFSLEGSLFSILTPLGRDLAMSYKTIFGQGRHYDAVDYLKQDKNWRFFHNLCLVMMSYKTIFG